MLPHLDILKSAQFTRSDVLEVTGLTPAQLKNTIDRDLVKLDRGHNPGTGRRRLFTGRDILKLTVAHSMSGVGFPMGYFDNIASTVVSRAENRLSMQFLGHEHPVKEFGLITYPIENDDWAYIPVHAEKNPPEDLPVCVQFCFVDRLIDRVFSKLNALVADEELPKFQDYRPPEYVNEYAPKSNFFRMWEKDDQDRWVYVGLSHNETQELLALKGVQLVGDDLVYDEEKMTRSDTAKERDRYLELDDKHERARLKRIGEEWEAEQ